MNYWLIKSEPITYGIDHLKNEKVTSWSGIRNYQARNFIRDQMKSGDLCLFYHSSTKLPADTGIVGVAKVVGAPYIDKTASDKKSPYFESNPKIQWFAIDMRFVKKFKRILTLAEIKADSKLKGIIVAKPGMRLSIQPVEKYHFDYIIEKLT